MIVDELVRDAISSEDVCLKFLRKFGIMAKTTCPCYKPGYDGVMKERRRSGRTIIKCTIKTCRSTKSTRKANRFFHFKDKNGRPSSKLSLCDIVRLAYFRNYTPATIVQLSKVCGNSTNTVCVWNNLLREVCSLAIEQFHKLVGTTENPVQIDESYFGGKAKYGRGRRLKGDRIHRNESKAQQELQRQHDSTVDESSVGQVHGPWFFGLNQNERTVRFIIVENRKATTLIPIIQHYIQEGSVLVSDEWAGYPNLRDYGYTHHTVCHKSNYVNPVTGFHTQAIERSWADAKSYITRARGTGPILQSHLGELGWRKAHDGVRHPENLFEIFWNDVRKVFEE